MFEALALRRQNCADSKAGEFIKTDPLMRTFEKAYGYVIFPNVGKVGFVIGERLETELSMSATI
jgi:lipid-binding SYLF domain-containing protein